MPNPVVKFRGAYLTERGVHFAIVHVEAEEVATEAVEKETNKTYKKYFPEGTPIILMVEEEGTKQPLFYGRKDIVAFLQGTEQEQIKWKNYTVQ